MSMMAERAMGAAQRRRERQLRAFHRHEQLTVRMALATALHHSAQRVEVPREVEEHEAYVGPRAQKTPPTGMRPASLAEPRGDVVLVQRHTVEQLADGAPRLPTLGVPVPQMVGHPVAVLARFDLPIPEQVIEVPKISCSPRFSRTVLRSLRMAEQLVGLQGYSWWLVGTDHQHGETAGDHRQPRAVYKYWARLRISLRSLVSGSHLFRGSCLRSTCVGFLGDSFRTRRIQRFLVRQWIHVIASLRCFCTRILRSILVLLSCLCLPRRVSRSCRQRHWYAWLVVLVSTHFALCSLLLFPLRFLLAVACTRLVLLVTLHLALCPLPWSAGP